MTNNDITANNQVNAQYIIPVISPFGSVNIYNKENGIANIIKIDNIIKLQRIMTIEIYDENGNIYNNNDVNCNFIFEYC